MSCFEDQLFFACCIILEYLSTRLAVFFLLFSKYLPLSDSKKQLDRGNWAGRIDFPYLDALVATAVAVLVASLFLFIMPPKKKSKKAAAALSPLKAHFEAIDAAIGKNENGLGQMLIRGVLQEDEDEDEDDDARKKDQDRTRRTGISYAPHHVTRRANALEEMEAVVLEQADERS